MDDGRYLSRYLWIWIYRATYYLLLTYIRIIINYDRIDVNSVLLRDKRSIKTGEMPVWCPGSTEPLTQPRVPERFKCGEC
jgi:hypothetical protein